MADIIHKIFGQKHSSKHSSDSSKGEGEGYSKHQAEFCKFEDCLADLSSNPRMYVFVCNVWSFFALPMAKDASWSLSKKKKKKIKHCYQLIA